jgi:hypothetical protein
MPIIIERRPEKENDDDDYYDEWRQDAALES